MLKCIKITPKNRMRFLRQIVALEDYADYPLGSDSFRIFHRGDYFSSFEDLGELYYYAVLDGNRVVAVAAGIIRDLPFFKDGHSWRAWYLCDLKIHPDYRGRHVPFRIIRRTFIPNYLRCRRGYAISMNPGKGKINRMARLLGRFRWAPLREAGMLQIYSLDLEQVGRCRAAIEKNRGEISFLSLEGRKDFVLRSTGVTAPLLHIQFGPCAREGGAEPQPGHFHLLCVPRGDVLEGELGALGIRPFTSASILQHGMADCDWKFILTSEI